MHSIILLISSFQQVFPQNNFICTIQLVTEIVVSVVFHTRFAVFECVFYTINFYSFKVRREIMLKFARTY